jgi:membrane-associated phospholipid phosphatase
MADAMDGQVSPAAGYPRLNLLGAAIICLSLLAIVTACYDASIASWVFHENLPRAIKQAVWIKIVKAPGNYYQGTLPIAAVAWFIAGRRRGGYAAALILLNGIPVGLFYTLGKWAVGRPRPYTSAQGLQPFEFHPFNHGIRGLWTAAHNQSFPSGHACLAFATAASLSFLWPRGGWLFFLLASLVGIERVLENAHYASDVVAGAMFGIIAAWTAQRALRPLAEHVKTEPGVGHG